MSRNDSTPPGRREPGDPLMRRALLIFAAVEAAGIALIIMRMTRS